MIDETNIALSKAAKREQLRKNIHEKVGDSESIFSVDSDLLQMMTFVMMDLIQNMQKDEASFQKLVSKLDVKSLKDKSLIFPIVIKRQYRSDDEIFHSMKHRYTQTSVCLSQYYYDPKVPVKTNNKKPEA